MPIRISLDNEIIEVDTSLEAWNRAYQQALDGNTMVEIQEPDGRIFSINPRRVRTVEAMGSPAAPELQQAQVA